MGEKVRTVFGTFDGRLIVCSWDGSCDVIVVSLGLGKFDGSLIGPFDLI